MNNLIANKIKDRKTYRIECGSEEQVSYKCIQPGRRTETDRQANRYTDRYEV